MSATLADNLKVFKDSVRSLIGPSGGLNYHLAALQYQNARWLSFRRDVGIWLNDIWNPQADQLIIFGPSAGWTLCPQFLSRFTTLICIEPDPLARALFANRFKSAAKIHFIKNTKLLPWFSQSNEGLSQLLGQYPNAAILYANLLGQIPLLTSHQKGEKFLQRAREEFFLTMNGRNWASYHDLLSGEPSADEVSSLHLRYANGPLTSSALQSLAAECFAAGSTVIDHETLWLSTNSFVPIRRQTSLALWDLRAQSRHLIGFVTSNHSF